MFSLTIYTWYTWKGIFHPLMEFIAKLLREDGNVRLEKGKSARENPWAHG
jgi:hypothetical protein